MNSTTRVVHGRSESVALLGSEGASKAYAVARTDLQRKD